MRWFLAEVSQVSNRAGQGPASGTIDRRAEILYYREGFFWQFQYFLPCLGTNTQRRVLMETYLFGNPKRFWNCIFGKTSYQVKAKSLSTLDSFCVW